MLNQAAVEALYSATYIEDYLDYVENLPDELTRYVTKVRELDQKFNGFLKEVEQHRDALLLERETSAKQKILVSKVQQALICAQELGDEKLQLLQQVQDIIDNKTRQLDLDYRNLAEIGKEPDSDPIKESGSRELSSLTNFSLNSNGSNGERQSKRVRRARPETGSMNESVIMEAAPVAEPIRQIAPVASQSTPSNSTSGNSQKKTGAAAVNKKKKKKTKQQQAQKDVQTSGTAARDANRDESPPREEEMQVDPDEPTYCLCDQISYGEMIMCDNDLCPYEWFHFSCVSLGVKPKGKWYCPKCRGDRSSVMKPKAQFLKELERIKLEKENNKEEKSS